MVPLVCEASRLHGLEPQISLVMENLMRQLFALVVILLLCGLAFAQDTWVLPGQYAVASPRVSTPIASADALPTPSLTLDTPRLAVGASNSTVENAAGSPVYFNQPEVYDPGAQPNPPAEEASTAQTTVVRAQSHGIALGAARFQSDSGVAEMVSMSPRRKATKVYTNADIAVMNDANGTIGYGGKLAHLN
jgi:hypothetical protein